MPMQRLLSVLAATAALFSLAPSSATAQSVQLADGRVLLASVEQADRVRATVDVDVVAVLEVPALPVDARHNAKVDRIRLQQWADKVLAGGRIGKP